MRRARWWLSCALAGVVLAAGCGGRVPPTHYYVLEMPGEGSDTVHGARSGGLEIGVASFAVDSPYDQDRLVYRVGRGSVEVDFYHYHRWATPLSRMLPQVVASGLEGTKGVRSIEPAGPARDYAATLDGRLVALEEVDTPEGPRVVVRLVLTLRLADGTEVWTARLNGEGAAESEGVRGLIEAVRDVLARVLEEARTGLADALR